MDFSKALEAMKDGKKVKRKGMKDGTYLIIQNVPHKEHNFWFFDPAYKPYVEFYFYDRAILADDWEIVEDIPEATLETHFVFFCPHCKTYRVLQQLKVCPSESNNITCGNCGKEIKLKLPKTQDP